MLNLKISQSSITVGNPVINSYFNEVNKYPLITPEKEMDLILKIKNGDNDARNELVCANLRFVISVANEHKKKYPFSEFLDLINVGNLGLIKAIEKFDETRGFKLISYAVSWIKQFMIEFSYKQDRTISLTGNAFELMNKINKASLLFEARNQRIPTPEEISEITGRSLKSVIFASGYSMPSYSLDYKSDDGTCLYDFLENNDSLNPLYPLDMTSMCENVQNILSILSDIQREVIIKTFGIGCDQKSANGVAFEMGLTKENVDNIKAVALRILRKDSSLKKIKEQLLAG